MKKEEMVQVLRMAAVNENTVTAMANSYDLGYEHCLEQGKPPQVKKGIDPAAESFTAIYEAVNGLTDQPAQQEPVPVELVGVEEAIKKGNGFWKSCTGCYETNEGHPPTGAFFSPVFKCHMGHGCSECGGIGAIWDDTDYEAMADYMMLDDAAPQPAQRKPLPLPKGSCASEWGGRETGPCLYTNEQVLEILAAHGIKE